jgi:hypothetical protein
LNVPVCPSHCSWETEGGAVGLLTCMLNSRMRAGFKPDVAVCQLHLSSLVSCLVLNRNLALDCEMAFQAGCRTCLTLLPCHSDLTPRPASRQTVVRQTVILAPFYDESFVHSTIELHHHLRFEVRVIHLPGRAGA